MVRPEFADEFERAAPALLAWAHLRVRPGLRKGLDPEDLVQEVGCRAFVRYGDFDPARATFRAWLFGFANRVLLEALRELGKGRPVRAEAADPSLSQVADSITAVSRRVARAETFRLFLQQVDGLDQEDRTLLVQIGIEGNSHAEVAAVLGIGEDAARKRWQRLRDRLRADPVFASLAAP
jgi:RNA polymerase sigma-70 factor (ECF subfamily)